LGLRPLKLSDTLVSSMFAEIERHVERVDLTRTRPTTDWISGDPTRWRLVPRPRWSVARPPPRSEARDLTTSTMGS